MTSELSTFAARLCESLAAATFVAESAPDLQPNSELRPRDSSLKAATRYVGSFEEEFPELALELFALQFAHNAAYRKFCATRSVTPLTIAHWSQIPAMPTTAFKEFEVTSLSPMERTHVFHSSGTTEQRPSRHFHSAESLAVYEASVLAGFAPLAAENRQSAIANRQLAILTPPPKQVPHSSLVHMFDCLRQKLGADQQAFCGRVTDGAWSLDLDQTLARLKSAETDGRPILLLGTAFSFVHLLDGMAERGLRLQLSSGSRVLETGGYKGRSRELPKNELHELLTERLGISPSQIVCEYGMSELSSQAYDTVSCARCQVSGDSSRITPHASRCFNFPPWARAQVISPETGREVAEGETGLLRVFDLANVFSVMAIQTEDLAVRRGDGFELLGRAARSEPRGCSLMAI